VDLNEVCVKLWTGVRWLIIWCVGNEPSIKGGVFLKQLSEYHLLKKDCFFKAA